MSDRSPSRVSVRTGFCSGVRMVGASVPRWLLAVGLGAIAASLHAAPPPEGAPVAVFERFDYSGHDARFDGPLGPGEYRNPILAGFHPDPSVCRVGSDFYLVNSSFTYFPGLPIFHSRDLVGWTPIGHVLTRPSQAEFSGLSVSRGVFAPAISHHHGRFYLVTTLVDRGGNCLFTAEDPAGPWSDPIPLSGVDGIDPSLFFDTDGRAWLVNNGPPPDNRPLYDGHRAIWLQEFDLARNALIGPRTIIVNGGTDLKRHPVWIEGPHLFRRGAWYYLLCAEGGTAENHSSVVFRSNRVDGPWQPYAGNPILTQRTLPGDRSDPVTCAGHAEIFQGPNDGWWAVFLGCRPYAAGHFNTGRETFLLPVTWTADDWPLILEPGVAIGAKGLAPLVAGPAPKPPVEPVGNFEWSDEFPPGKLDPEWNSLRGPSRTWCQPSPGGGGLTLVARPVSLASLDVPSFIGRRQEHANFTASVELRLPASEAVTAGLVAFQNETHHFFLGVQRQGDSVLIRLERAEGGPPGVVASIRVPASGRLGLLIAAEGGTCRFSYSSIPGSWMTLGPPQDNSVLSTKTAGGFVGTYLGVYARLDR